MSEEKISKQTFSCNICNYSTTTRSGYARHISSVKHKNKAEGKQAGFHCEYCNFQCDYIKDYNVHILSIKHNNMVSSIIPTQCSYCKRVYSSKKNLWRHKQTCKEANVDKSDDDTPNSDSEDIDKNTLIEVITSLRKEVDELKKSKSNTETTPRDDLIIEILKSNKEMQNCMIQQTTDVKNMVETVAKNMVESVAKNMGGTNNTNNSHNNNLTNTNNSHNTTNNQTFNINYFLNEHCKNAVDIHDFIQNLDYSQESLKKNAHLTYPARITKQIREGLGNYNVEDRPIHCSDEKRKKIYIKHNGEWVTEYKFNDVVSKIGENNTGTFRQWAIENPNFRHLDTPEYEQYMNIYPGNIGPTSDEQEEKYSKKIIGGIIDEILIDKEKYAT